MATYYTAWLDTSGHFHYKTGKALIPKESHPSWLPSGAKYSVFSVEKDSEKASVKRVSLEEKLAATERMLRDSKAQPALGEHAVRVERKYEVKKLPPPRMKF